MGNYSPHGERKVQAAEKQGALVKSRDGQPLDRATETTTHFERKFKEEGEKR